MESIFLDVLNISITTSLFILAVVAFRLLFKDAPKYIRCILWCLVALRLVVPFSIESPFSFVPKTEPVDSTRLYVETTQRLDNTTEEFTKPTTDIASPVTESEVEIESSFNVLIVASYIWISGAGIMLLYALLSYIRVRLNVRESLRLKDNIYLCEKVDTPFILGIIKPKIYLPYEMADDDREFVVMHEKAHLKRLDHLWKPFGFMVLSVYWFNPVIWFGFVLFSRDIELACDEKVIRKIGNEGKKAYSNTLINCSAERKMITACPLAFGETSVKSRVKSVLNYKKPAFWVIVISLIATLVLTIGFLTEPKTGFEDIINENGYTILRQEASTLSVFIPHNKITEDTFKTEQIFKENEYIACEDDITIVYLKSIRPDLNALEFCYEFSYKELPIVGKVNTSLTQNNKNCLYLLCDWINTSDSTLEIAPRLRTNEDGSFSLTIPMEICKQIAQTDDKYFVEIGCNAIYYKKNAVSENEVSYFDGEFNDEETLFMATELIYDCGVFSYVPQLEYQPYYIVTGDMYISEIDRETQIITPKGKMQKVRLEDYKSFFFEPVWSIAGYSFEKLNKENENTWVYKDVKQDEIILMSEQKDGSLYIAIGAYGSDNSLEGGFFRVLFELTKLTDTPSLGEYPLPYLNDEECISQAEVDIDGDGEKELCLIYTGPTSGILSATIVVQELGAKSLQEDGIYTVYYTLSLPSFVAGENGELYVNTFDEDLLKVTVDKELKEVVLLDENGEKYPTNY